MKRFIRNLFRAAGYDLRRHAPDLLDFIRAREINVVFDIGANRGQFGLFLRRWGYRGEIVSFEPIKADYAALIETAARYGPWIAHNVALGAAGGSLKLNVSENSEFSSFLSLAGSAPHHDPHSQVARQEEVEIGTVDSAAGAYLGGNLLLKIDTQGFERQVLLGARETLAYARAVQLELPIIHLYEGTWRLSEALDYMRSSGFVPAQIVPVNYHSADRVSMVEVDCLFRRISAYD